MPIAWSQRGFLFRISCGECLCLLDLFFILCRRRQPSYVLFTPISHLYQLHGLYFCHALIGPSIHVRILSFYYPGSALAWRWLIQAMLLCLVKRASALVCSGSLTCVRHTFFLAPLSQCVCLLCLFHHRAPQCSRRPQG
jgi:hypothetical protein